MITAKERRENMKTLNIYMIYTENKHNQILVFENYNDAVSWCKSATSWNDKEIKENIKQPYRHTKTKYYNIFI